MKSNADITSISGRRPPTHRGGWASAVVVAAFAVLIGFGAAVAGTQERREIGGLPADERAGIYARVADDLERTCTAPSAQEGALRDHCRREAAFVVLFPECDARSASLARSILPHARR
jgi:hypothetical protein